MKTVILSISSAHSGQSQTNTLEQIAEEMRRAARSTNDDYLFQQIEQVLRWSR